MPQVFQQTLWVGGTGAEGEGQEVARERREMSDCAQKGSHETEERACVKKARNLRRMPSNLPLLRDPLCNCGTAVTKPPD